MRRTLLTGILAMVCCFLSASADACECYCSQRWLNNPVEMKRHAKAVFVGEVLEEREATRDEARELRVAFVVRMRVERFWKGVKTPEMVVNAMGELAPGCCGVSLKAGQRYLIYAVGRELSTGCTRSRHLEGAGEDLRALGPAQTFAQSQ
jgi:hypothetical protein